jgi:cell division protein FtsB
MKDDRGKLDLSLLIEQHKQEIWKYKQKESEWEYTKNLLEGTKQIVVDLSAEVVELKRANDVMKDEIDRLSEENANLSIIREK